MTQHVKLLIKAPSDKLSDVETVKWYLTETVRRVGMAPLGDPVVHLVPLDPSKLDSPQFQDDGGVTCQLVGFTTLTTSHIAIHTWPLRQEAHIDLYSCKDFDKSVFVLWTQECLLADMVKISDLSHACRW